MRRRFFNNYDQYIPIDINNYLTIEALEDKLTVNLSINACEYCVDGDGNWLSLAAGTTTQSVNAGHTLSFRGNLTPTSSAGIGTFIISKKCNLEGNCMSMLFGDNAASNTSLSGKSYAFYKLFHSCTNIVSVSENFLPATTLAMDCYVRMFENCTNLTTAPNVPATTLATNCYNHMFHSCTNLTTAPALPATTLATNCYQYMFYNCTSLTSAPALPATTLAYYCYQYMFYNCISLTSAPALPATTLVRACYYRMFEGCTKLNYIKMLATNISAYDCLYYWVYGVASTGTFVKNPDATWEVYGNSGIPNGWTVKFDGEDDDGIDTTLQFPLYIYFDYCETGFGGGMYCYGSGDYAELNKVIQFVVETYGEDTGHYHKSVDEAKLYELGIEIYVEGEKVRYFNMEYDCGYLGTDVHSAIMVTDVDISWEG